MLWSVKEHRESDPRRVSSTFRIMMKTFQKADIYFGPPVLFYFLSLFHYYYSLSEDASQLSPRNSAQHCCSCLREKIRTARKAHSPDFGSSTGNLNSKILNREDRPPTGAFGPDQADLTWNRSKVIRLRGWMQRRPDRHLNSQIFWFCETDFCCWLWELTYLVSWQNGWMIYLFNFTAKSSALVLIYADAAPLA